MATILLDDHGLINKLNNLQQFAPKALSDALNTVAFKARTDLVAEERSRLKLTREFIPRSTQVEMSRHSTLQAEVGVTSRVYFAPLLDSGGARLPIKAKNVAVPVAGKRIGRPRTLLNNTKKYFYRNINGVKGIWRNNKKGISLVFNLESSTHYNKPPYVDFDGTVYKSAVRQRFDEVLAQAFLRAMR